MWTMGKRKNGPIKRIGKKINWQFYGIFPAYEQFMRGVMWSWGQLKEKFKQP